MQGGRNPRATPRARAPLDGLPAALADVVCWILYYLDRCAEEEIDADVASQLSEVVAATLRRQPVEDRVAFLEHAARRATSTEVADYQGFLLELAETLGLE